MNNKFNNFINLLGDYNIYVDLRYLGGRSPNLHTTDAENLNNIIYILDNIERIDMLLHLHMVDDNLHIFKALSKRLHNLREDVMSLDCFNKKREYTLSVSSSSLNLTAIEALLLCSVLDKVVLCIGTLYRAWVSKDIMETDKFHPDVLAELSARIKQKIGDVATDILYDYYLPKEKDL